MPAPGARRNFTLDRETAALLQAHVDRVERELGFRPSLAQAVRGLIAKAGAGSTRITGDPRSIELIVPERAK